MTATPYADATPSPAPQEATPEAAPAKPTRVAAIPPKKPEKPAMVAKAHRPLANNNAPAQTVALHPPPTAPGNVAGPYRVQFGAFANEDNARRVQWAIEATGLNVEVSQEPGPSGHPLYFLRSPSYSDYAAALSAAQTVQHRVNGFVNAIPIDYAILGNHSVVQQQAER
jgi:cell division protein FtsN